MDGRGESMSKVMQEKHSATCPCCTSTNVYGMSRVVGYYSIIENWNDSKKAELKDRQKGTYKLSDKPKMELSPQIIAAAPQNIKVSVH